VLTGNGLKPEEEPDAVKEISYHDHVCLLSEGPDDNLDFLTRFFQEGLHRGGLCVYVSRDEDARHMFAHMRSEGLDIDGLIQSGRLVHVPRTGVVIKDGRFEPD
jgi:hypothetical protein